MTTFLVACDGSDHAARAVLLAARHAAALGARVLLLHVAGDRSLPEGVRQLALAEHLVEPHAGRAMPGIARLPSWVSEFRPVPDDPREIRDVAQAFGHQVLERAFETAREVAPAAEIELALLEGEAAAQILACASESEADLLVLGRRGLGAIEEVLLGSVSTKVLHGCGKPCLIVP